MGALTTAEKPSKRALPSKSQHMRCVSSDVPHEITSCILLEGTCNFASCQKLKAAFDPVNRHCVENNFVTPRSSTGSGYATKIHMKLTKFSFAAESRWVEKTPPKK